MPDICCCDKDKTFGQSCTASTNYSQPGRNYGDEGRSALQCEAQDLDTSSYQVSDLEIIEFNWENSQLEMDTMCRPGIETAFSPKIFDDSSMGGSVENPIVLDKQQDKANSPHPPSSTSESVRPWNLPGCRAVVLLEQELKMFRILFKEICFNKYHRVCVLI